MPPDAGESLSPTSSPPGPCMPVPSRLWSRPGRGRRDGRGRRHCHHCRLCLGRYFGLSRLICSPGPETPQPPPPQRGRWPPSASRPSGPGQARRTTAATVSPLAAGTGRGRVQVPGSGLSSPALAGRDGRCSRGGCIENKKTKKTKKNII